MSDFSRNIAQWANKVNKDVDKVIRAAVIDVSTRIIRRTPVDTGRARGNWIPSIDAPKLKPINRITPVGGAVINDVREISNGLSGHVFYLTNNLPYIGRLEYQGWSKQAPVGMVRVSVIEFNDALRKAISNVQ